MRVYRDASIGSAWSALPVGEADRVVLRNLSVRAEVDQLIAAGEALRDVGAIR